MINGPVIHLENHIANVRVALRIAAFQITIDHLADDIVFLDLARIAIKRCYSATIAQHRDLVSYFTNFIELVRNQDRSDALRAKLAQQCQQGRTISFVEACRRLIKDQKAHTLGKRLGNFNKLLFADTNIRHQSIRRFRQANLLQKRLCAAMHLAAVNNTIACRRIDEKNILGNRHERHQRQLLMDDDNAERFGIIDIAEVALFSVEEDRTSIAARGINTRQHFHQR